MAGKSSSIVYISNKDMILNLKVEDKKFKVVVAARGKEETPEIACDLKEDFMIFLIKAFNEVHASPEPKTVTTVQSEWRDGGYKAQICYSVNKTANGTYSMTIVENGKGTFDFPIMTIAAISYGGTPMKEAERSVMGMEKLMLKLGEAYKLLMDLSISGGAFKPGFQKPGNNFSQQGYNNTAGTGQYNQQYNN